MLGGDVTVESAGCPIDLHHDLARTERAPGGAACTEAEAADGHVQRRTTERVTEKRTCGERHAEDFAG
jgi:hypothetical protein